MYDRTVRRGFGGQDGPGPYLAHPSHSQKPSIAGFGSTANRPELGRLPKSELPAAQYLAHAAPEIHTNATVQSSFLSTAARWKPLVDDRPGPGAYEVGGLRTSPIKLSRSRSPSPERAVSRQRHNPPTIPSTRDNGYEVSPDGKLVPKAIPVATTSPGPGQYSPASSRAASPTPGYGRDRSQRSQFDKMLPASPGPAQYKPVDPSHPAFHPSARLKSWSMQSGSAKGMDAISRRPTTASGVGPGSYRVESPVNPVKPRLAEGEPLSAHMFGSTSPRIPRDPVHVGPSPAEYKVLGVLEEAAARAQAKERQIRAAAEKRMEIKVGLRPITAPVGEVPALAAKPAPLDPVSQLIAETPSLLVPTFGAASPRFQLPMDQRDAMRTPAPTAYSIPASTDVSPTARAASPHRNHTFMSTEERFALQRMLEAASNNGSGGPGAYEVEPVPTARTAAARAKNSASFASTLARDAGPNAALPNRDVSGTAATFGTGEVRTSLVLPTANTAAQAGKLLGVTAPRSPERPSDTPGPGAYELAPSPVDVVAVKTQALLAVASGLVSPIYTMGRDIRTHERDNGIPSVATYKPEYAESFTRRSFNVDLAANEARATLIRGVFGLQAAQSTLASSAWKNQATASSGSGGNAHLLFNTSRSS